MALSKLYIFADFTGLTESTPSTGFLFDELKDAAIDVLNVVPVGSDINVILNSDLADWSVAADGIITAHTGAKIETLAEAKTRRYPIVNNITDKEILKGFTYDSTVFSQSAEAQLTCPRRRPPSSRCTWSSRICSDRPSTPAPAR